MTQRIRTTLVGGALIVVVLLATGSAAGASSSGASRAGLARRATTPQLIEAAHASGSIDRATADLHLAQAFGDYDALPAQYKSETGWFGTTVLRNLDKRVSQMQHGAKRDRIERVLEPDASDSVTSTCSSSSTPHTTEHNTTNFHITYTTIAGGLVIGDYAASLEEVWTTEVTSFGWAAPPVKASNPPPGNRYHVRIDNLGGGLYGFVSSGGTHAGNVGDNPNTAWNEGDAQASCMSLNRDYGPFPGTSQQAMDSTTAHEFNHSIQYGYGALNGNFPDDLFVEGGATWMEDEAQDTADDNWNYLHPDYQQGFGDFDGSPYPGWILLRGLTERFGTNTAGAGEQVMQDMFEAISKNTHVNLAALALGLSNKGVTLADATHDGAIASAFMRTCGGSYALPYCYEEAAGYIASAGVPAVHGTIAAVGGSINKTAEDDFGASWVAVPTNAGTYSLTLQNTSPGGLLRATAVCDTGSALVRTAFPTVAGTGASSTLPAFASAGCVRAIVVTTNQFQTAGNPSSSPARTYTLSTAGGGGGTGTLSIADAAMAEGNSGTANIGLTVTLSEVSGSEVSVGFSTVTGKANGNATANVDFTTTTGTVTIPAGQLTGTANVPIIGDTNTEANEFFSVKLASPVGATITDGTGIATITNDDGGGGGTPTVSISDASVVEGNKSQRDMTFTVSLSNTTTSAVTVLLSTSDGTAVAPGDYTSRTSFLVTIPANTLSVTVTVSVKGDRIDEGASETFTVTLSSPTNATLGDASGVGTITDDD